MSNFGNPTFNMGMGSFITEQEIQNRKNKLNELINKLINTHNIEDETSFINEIKNQTDFLSSLLNIKRNELNQNNNMNNIQIQQQIMQQQMMQQQMMQQQMMQQQMNNIQNTQKIIGFTVHFRIGQNLPSIGVQCMPDEKISSIIEKYRKKSGDSTAEKFIFNSHALSPFLTAAESGLTNNANIFVVETKVVGG